MQRPLREALTRGRYDSFGEMEENDPDRAAAYRESLEQELGKKLMTELPPAQGATILKRLFV